MVGGEAILERKNKIRGAEADLASLGEMLVSDPTVSTLLSMQSASKGNGKDVNIKDAHVGPGKYIWADKKVVRYIDRYQNDSKDNLVEKVKNGEEIGFQIPVYKTVTRRIRYDTEAYDDGEARFF
jgi:hypothetical protein